MTKKILIVEDDVSILIGLVDLLSSEGYEVFQAKDGQRALELYHAHKPHLILLDVMMPEKSGYDVCKEIRKTDPHTIIIMLTAKQQEVDKVVGLEVGADDYIIKPFGVNELLARIRAALRRIEIKPNNQINHELITFGDVVINPKTLTGTKSSQPLTVTSREVHILQLFIRHKGEVVSRLQLLDDVWGIKYEGTTRTLDQHIAQLRKKIETNPSSPQHIVTVHGEGYRFNG